MVIFWMKNLSRTLVVILGCYISIEFQSVLDEFLGVSGAILGISIILVIPTLCHYKLCAKTKADRFADLFIIVSCSILCIVCTYNGIKSWGRKD